MFVTSHVWCSLLAVLLCCALSVEALLSGRHAKDAADIGMKDSPDSAARDTGSSGNVLEAGTWETLRAQEESTRQHMFGEMTEDEAFPPNFVHSFDWRWSGADEPHGSCPSMFVVVMSRRENIDGRKAIRDMWKDSAEGWGKLQAKFGLCKHVEDHVVEDLAAVSRLTSEFEQHNDIVFLDCKEGYLHGQLTRKVLAAMTIYLSNHSSYDLFMKTDDDTFVSTGRLCDYLSAQPAKKNNFRHSYMGVFAEIGEFLNARKMPCRDATSSWYEPFSKYNETTYPTSAKGGPGYILSHKIVNEVIENRIADDYVLNNEDKAVGVWIDALKRSGQTVDYVNLPGTDGYDQWHPLIRKSGAWGWYPYVVHHHLEGDEIACLHKVDRNKKMGELIDRCFVPKATEPIVLRANRSQEQKPQNLRGRREQLHFSEQQLACMGA